MRRTRRVLIGLAVAAVAASTLTACRGHANDFSSAAGSTTLTIQGDLGNPTLTADFNPFQNSPVRLGGSLLIYEPLEIRSPVDGSYTPFLATGYKFTTPTQLAYSIRGGVTWSDGTPFTPADVVFTFELLKKYPALDTTGIWAQLSGISASGNTVTATFKKPNVPFAGIVAAVPIVPQHIWSTISDPSKYADAKPIGTGPFTLSTFSPTGYVLKKNGTYWQSAKVAPAAVSFPAQSTNQSTNQFEVSSGRFDWAYQFLPDVQQTYVSRSKSNTYWFPPGGAICLYMNLTKAPYTNADYRRGISLALNRDTIATKAVNGYLGGASQSGLILPNLQKWLDPSLADKGNVTQSVTASKAAFAKAGYTSSGGRLVNSSGQQASMTLVIPGGYSDWVAAGKEVVTELSAVGMKVTLQLPQAPQYTQQIDSGNFDAAFGGFGGTGDPYTDFNNALNSSFATPINTPTVNNFERFKDSTVDAALATLAKATDYDQQKAATDTLEQVMYQQVPIVTLYYGGSWGLFSTKNFVGWPSASAPYTLPTPYNNAMLTVLTHLTRASV